MNQPKQAPERIDLAHEEYREYDFGGRWYRVVNPVALYVGQTTHRVVDSDGIVHCFPVPGAYGCILRWKSRDPEKPVEF